MEKQFEQIKKERKEEFENQFRKEILKSEKMRVTILGTLTTIPFIVLTFFTFFMKEKPAYLDTNPYPLYIILGLLFLFLIREFRIRFLLDKYIKQERNIDIKLRYLNIMAEVSIPSIAILMLSYFWEPEIVLSTPAVLLYVLIIILTTLVFDHRLSVLAGAVAAIEYFILAIYLLQKFPAEANSSMLSNPNLYVVKSLMIFLSGVACSFAAGQLRKRISETLHQTEERERIINMFGQQVSQEIVDELVSQKEELKSKRKFVCIMFLDIRGFTPFAEKKEPEEIISYQNKIFGFMIDAITRNNGIINQFLGDGYMATFGAPISRGNDCQNAVNAAVEIIKEIERKNNSGEIPYTNIGIGLHAGYVVAGNVGTSVRKQYSISGNTVILASRVEQLNKTYNSRLLISEEVLHNVSFNGITPEPLGDVKIKGREKPMSLYKIA